MNILLHKLRQNFSYVIKSPLNINLFKSEQGLSQVKNSLKARFRQEKIADQICQKLQEYRKSLHELEMTNKTTNEINNKIKSEFKKNTQKDDQVIEKLKIDMANIKKQQKNLQDKLIQTKSNLQSELMKVGNLVHSDVFVSKDQNFNKVLKYYPQHENMSQVKNQLLSINKTSTSYQQLNQNFNISDLKRGQKVSGHRGYFLTTNGVKLAMALSMYGVNFLQEKGYKLYQAPAMIFESLLKQNCQLQTVQNDMYKLQGEQSYLIATSQQSMASYYKNQVLQNKQLPLKMAGYSTCFRKQAGAHGKDIHGLFRVHQFQKVEQFIICEGQLSKSQQMMNKMLQTSQQFYQSLKIPYRVVDIVSGELNDAAIRKFDLQGWYPSQKKYRQLVSISNCTDYQSRLVNVQYRKGNQTEYVHMLNGTLTAVERTITCILQNYYDSSTQRLNIPEKLQKFIGKQYFQKTVVT